MSTKRCRQTIALGLCASAQVVLGGCTAKGSGAPVTPFPPSQTHVYVFNAAPNGGGIASFPITAAGNVAPAALIAGNLTGLDAPFYGTIDGAGAAYAPNTAADSVTSYAPGSNGDAGPATDLTGSSTGLGHPSGIALASSGDYYVCNSQAGSPYTSITQYAAGSSGNAAPIATIRGPSTTLSFPADVALDASAYVYVTNGYASSGGGWVAVFSPNSNGNVAPARLIRGSATGLSGPAGIALDASGNAYVSNHGSNSISVFASGANGNVAPIRAIAGSNTGLNAPTGIAVDSNGYVYVANSGTPSVTVYAAGASGNVVPTRTIAGSKTGLDRPYGIALY